MFVSNILILANNYFEEILKAYDLFPAALGVGGYISNEDDSRLIEPIEVQNKIDEIVNEFKNNKGRCFVRASGTEDVVRIYSEADSEGIAKIISEKVYEILE